MAARALTDVPGRLRATPRVDGAVVDGPGGRARAPRRCSGGLSRAPALRDPSRLAQAGALAGGAARRVLAGHARHHPEALAANAAGHVPAAARRHPLEDPMHALRNNVYKAGIVGSFIPHRGASSAWPPSPGT